MSRSLLISFKNFLNLNSLYIIAIGNNEWIFLSLVICILWTIIIGKVSDRRLCNWLIFVCNSRALRASFNNKLLDRVCFHSLNFKWSYSVAVCLVHLEVIRDGTFEFMFIDSIYILHFIALHFSQQVAILCSWIFKGLIVLFIELRI